MQIKTEKRAAQLPVNLLSTAADVIRALALDAVSTAGSGHAGTAMGCAEIGAYLYGHFLRYVPEDPQWMNRDRFILSAGHASLLQYSCLHLAGFSISLEDLKKFRQIDSVTPSHPEYRRTEGVETTTGLDGQGIAHGVGQALGLKLLGNKINRDSCTLLDAKVVVLAGDGCFMEGICHESSALAGHWNLDNLILIYDSNQTSLDGFVHESCSENTRKRYEAYGWHVEEVQGDDLVEIEQVFGQLRNHQEKPTLIIAHTVIGKSIGKKAGTALIHSGPVSDEERSSAKQTMGLEDKEFHVPEKVQYFFKEHTSYLQTLYREWKEKFFLWEKEFPSLATDLKSMDTRSVAEEAMQKISLPNKISGRQASHIILQSLARWLPSLYGGSADLSRSDGTYLHDFTNLQATDFSGRNIKYGVREFGMGCIAIGLAQTGKILPFVGTFLAFSDYMISSIRMACLMQLQIIYQLTHDAFWIGQDGPTHQPVEQLAHLRSIPGLQVIRPADGNEVKMAWLAAIDYAGPTALILSRQDLVVCPGTEVDFDKGVGRGAYFVKQVAKPAITLIATGSELFLAFAVADLFEKQGIEVEIISMPCWERFQKQSKEYQDSLLGTSTLRVSLEAGSSMGWHRYVQKGLAIGIDSFGMSATATQLADRLGFTPQAIKDRIDSFLTTIKQ